MKDGTFVIYQMQYFDKIHKQWVQCHLPCSKERNDCEVETGIQDSSFDLNIIRRNLKHVKFVNKNQKYKYRIIVIQCSQFTQVLEGNK